MTRTSIKSTYSLDIGTIRKLERLAARWRVSKSEVLCRAIDAIVSGETYFTPSPLETLRKLRRKFKLTQSQADSWQRKIRRERSEAFAGRAPVNIRLRRDA